MTAIHLKKISKKFSEQTMVLNDISLSIQSGEFVVFVGSSGCGKSTLLRVIAGLDVPSSGEIWFDDDLMNDVTPAHRQIGMVFQSYALYPNMSVRENLSFGLKQKKLTRSEITHKVDSIAKKLEIDALLDLKPAKLSGGQQQRVAIGRCLVQSPRVFLLDEPLSNLDADLRNKTRREIKSLHQKLKATMIYVTHDQIEAMTLADKIAVFSPATQNNKGNLQQFGTPLELYNQPCNKFVAGFLGTPKINFIPATVINVNDQETVIELTPGCQIVLTTPAKSMLSTGQAVELAIRPEHLHLNSLTDRNNTVLPAELTSYENLGSETLLYGQLAGVDISLKLAEQIDPTQLQNQFDIHFNQANCFLFDPNTGERLI